MLNYLRLVFKTYLTIINKQMRKDAKLEQEKHFRSNYEEKNSNESRSEGSCQFSRYKISRSATKNWTWKEKIM